jgi:hypothetical protein
MATLIVQVATERAPKLFSLAPKVPLAVCAVVDRALEFEPDRRYSSAREMQIDVRDVRANRPPRVAANALPSAGAIPELEPASRRADDAPPPSLTPESFAAERARQAAKAAAASADFHGQAPQQEMPTVARDVPQYYAQSPSYAAPQPAQAPQGGDQFKATMMQVAPSNAAPVGRSTGSHLASTMYAVETTPASPRQQAPQPQPGWNAAYAAPTASPSYANAPAQPMPNAAMQAQMQAMSPPLAQQPLNAAPVGYSTGGYAAPGAMPIAATAPMPMPTPADVAPPKKKSRVGCALVSIVLLLVLAAAAVYVAREYFGIAIPLPLP